MSYSSAQNSFGSKSTELGMSMKTQSLWEEMKEEAVSVGHDFVIIVDGVNDADDR